MDAVDLDTHTDLDGDTVNIDVKDTNNDFGDADYFDDLGDDAELEDLEVCWLILLWSFHR